ncbi:MAG: Ig-like domain-containing protein [Methanoregula sp.]
MGLYLFLLIFLLILPAKAIVAKDDTFSTAWSRADFCMFSGDNVLLNDIPYSSSLTAELVRGPNRGSLTLMPDGDVTYCPSYVFVGADTFYYRDYDGVNYSNVAKVTYYVYEAPVSFTCKSPTYTIMRNTTNFEGLISSYRECPGHSCSVHLGTSPSHGSVDFIDNDGGFGYTPFPSFSGTDSFTYYYESDDQWNGILCQGTVIIHVINPPQVPEFPSVVILPIMLLGIVAVVIIMKMNKL